MLKAKKMITQTKVELMKKRTGIYFLSSLIAAFCFSLAISFQTHILGFDFAKSQIIKMGAVHSLFFLICFFLYIKFEDWLIKNKSAEIPKALYHSIFLIFISSVILLRTQQGIPQMLDTSSVLLFVIFRFALFVLFKQKIDLKNSGFNKTKKYLPTIVIWFVCIYAFIIIKADGDLGNFLWEGTDARHYKWLSDQFTIMESIKSYFAVGLPILLTPFNLIAGTYYSRDYTTVFALIPYTIILFTGVIWPISLILLQKAIIKVTSLKDTVLNNTSIGLFVILMNFLYFAYVPSYTIQLDLITHNVMVFGIVPAVEVINLLLVNFSIYAIVNHKKVNHLLVGLVLGFAFITKSSNVIPIGIFVLIFFLIDRDIKKMIRIGLMSLLVFSVQFAYAQLQFGGGFFPGRDYQNERRFEDSDKWRNYIEDQYGFEVETPAPLNLKFVERNLDLTFSHYAVPIVLTVISTLFLLARRDKKLFAVLAYSFILIMVFWLFHTAYIRLGATFRYYHLLLSPFILINFTAAVEAYRKLKV